MELLQKFAAVEIQANHRITKTDKDYCEQHQKAYEAAITNFQELAFFCADMAAAQDELLGDRKSPYYYDYLASHDGPAISQEAILLHAESLHADFITVLVQYFNTTYHISIDSLEISQVLLPKKPDEKRQGSYKQRCEEYHKQMRSLTVRYQDVVDQIILRLSDRSFSEQAFYELYCKCHDAAWDTNAQKPKFERRKDTIIFTGNFCNLKSCYKDVWEVSDSMREILWGLAHFETGSYCMIPAGFHPLLGFDGTKETVIEFPTCKMAKQIKLFKSGRVDLKFHSPEFAEQFVNKYLGLVS